MRHYLTINVFVENFFFVNFTHVTLLLCLFFLVFDEQVEKLLRAVADGDVEMVSSFRVTLTFIINDNNSSAQNGSSVCVLCIRCVIFWNGWMRSQRKRKLQCQLRQSCAILCVSAPAVNLHRRSGHTHSPEHERNTSSFIET